MIPPRQTIRFHSDIGQTPAGTPASSGVPAASDPLINLTEALINAEWRIIVLEHIIDKLIEVAPPDSVTADEMETWRANGLAELQKKYPNAGLARTL